ncbi:hypothetical protein CANARDRAFT_189251, partial [[Candida] arabinofermentans NRRL YB-2248]
RNALHNNQFVRQLINISNVMQLYNVSSYHSSALDVFQASPVIERVEQSDDDDNGDDYSDRIVKGLLKWFKEDFFKWVNKADCIHCGNTNQDKITALPAVRGYTGEHRQGQAGIIEKYKCEECGGVTEFPRFKNPEKLLTTRKGRCGEWNDCFILILKSLGYNVRYIWNLEDHVWCEYYSKNLKRWIHLDSCENAFDNPMLYNRGWGKRMSYVLAIHDSYIIDVSYKYIDSKSDKSIPRNKITETDYQKVLAFITTTKLIKIQDD